VSTPQEVALADARKGINMFRMDSLKVPVFGIVENMAGLLQPNYLLINITFLAKMGLRI
jgi:Mrp family chromosome partitioning ATPase